jgi:hypothetical protein
MNWPPCPSGSPLSIIADGIVIILSFDMPEVAAMNLLIPAITDADVL